MRVIIAGGRDFTDMRVLSEAIKASGFNVTEVVSGCAPGADTLGVRWAYANDVHTKEFPAKWKLFGRAAGPKRNQEMVDWVRICAGPGERGLIALPGGKGTADMIRRAMEGGLTCYVVDEEKARLLLAARGWKPYEKEIA